MTAQTTKSETATARVQLDVDRFSEYYTLTFDTYDDTVEIHIYGRVVWCGPVSETPNVWDLVVEVHRADPADFADWDDLDD